MKKTIYQNIIVFVFLIVLPHLIRIYYKDSVGTETLALLQYASLIISFFGGLFIISINYKNRKKSGSNIVSTLLILLGFVVAILSQLLLYLVYAFSGGIGF